VNRRPLLVALLLVASCARPTARRPAPADPAKSLLNTAAEQSSLLDLTRGASIYSRTGESMLIASAVNVIDGSTGSFWAPPPHDYPQSIVIALGAPARISRVGFRSVIEAGYEANHVSFERSVDGVAWQPLTTMTSRHIDEPQWSAVAPADAAFMRVTVPDLKNATRDVHLQSVLAEGTEISARVDPPIAGCWSINGADASFAQQGTRATGVVQLGRQPLFLAGGTDGRMWRFNWIRGNDYGYTALSLSPDGKRLSALNWHEEAIPMFAALPWMGSQVPCANTPQLALLHRAGRVSLFALRFDAKGTLLTDASRDELQALAALLHNVPVPVRFVGHEFRGTDARANMRITEREVFSLREALTVLRADLKRVTFVAAGSEAPRQTPASDAARAIYSSVEMEVRR